MIYGSEQISEIIIVHQMDYFLYFLTIFTYMKQYFWDLTPLCSPWRTKVCFGKKLHSLKVGSFESTQSFKSHALQCLSHFLTKKVIKSPKIFLWSKWFLGLGLSRSGWHFKLCVILELPSPRVMSNISRLFRK